eukprot:5800799-Pyramimonas_sp.AAC.1
MCIRDSCGQTDRACGSNKRTNEGWVCRAASEGWIDTSKGWIECRRGELTRRTRVGYAGRRYSRVTARALRRPVRSADDGSL